MTRAAIAAAAGVIPLVALVVAPSTVGPAFLLAAFATLAAFHGLGRAVGWLTGDDDAPLALVALWGAAAYVALAGVLLAAGALGPAARAVLLGAGIAAGAAWLARRARPIAVRSLAVGAGLAAVAAIGLLAAAGHASAGTADPGALGQLRQLEDTGGLGDGAVRDGLGGDIVLAATASAAGDLRAALAVDSGVMLVLVVGWLGWALGAAPAAVAASLLVVALALHLGLAPPWSLVALALGCASTLARAADRRSAPHALVAVAVAAALAAVHPAGLVLAAAAVAAAARAVPDRARDVAAAGVAVIALVVGPYALSLAAAWRALGMVSPALTSPTADDGRGLAIAAALAIAALVAARATRAATTRLHPLLAVTLAATAALTLCRFPAGPSRQALPGHAAAVLADARAVLRAPPTAPGADARDHAAVIATIASAARVGVVVDRPDLIDRAGRRLVDLSGLCPHRRTPCRALAAALDRLRLDAVVLAAPTPTLGPGWQVEAAPASRLSVARRRTGT
jgi:hypothetical protein